MTNHTLVESARQVTVKPISEASHSRQPGLNDNVAHRSTHEDEMRRDRRFDLTFHQIVHQIAHKSHAAIPTQYQKAACAWSVTIKYASSGLQAMRLSVN